MLDLEDEDRLYTIMLNPEEISNSDITFLIKKLMEVCLKVGSLEQQINYLKRGR